VLAGGTGNPRAVLRATAAISHFDWSPDGAALVAALKSGEVWIWDWAGQKRTGEISPTEGAVPRQVSWSPSGDLIAACGKRKIFLWNPATGGGVKCRELPGVLGSAAWARDGRTIHLALLIGQPPAQRLELAAWDLESDRLDTLHADPAWNRSSCGISSDRRWITPLRTDGWLEVWDLQNLGLVRVLRCPHRGMTAAAVSPDQTTLAVSFGGEVDLWDLTTGKPQPPLGRDEAAIYSLAFSSGGELLAGKSRQGSIRLWRCKDWSERVDIEEPSVRGQSPEIAFHPARPFLATYDQWNTALRIWELEPADIPLLRPGLRKILFLSANPRGAQLLRTDREAREIRRKLEPGRFEIRYEPAAQPEDVHAALQKHQPDIVHFASHGNSNGSTLMEGPNGEPSLISQRALTNVLALFSNKLECVVLNVCHSEVQARSISQAIENVIGMSRGIDDRSAIAFSTGFYQALGDGLSVAGAYRSGCSLIDMKGLPGFDVPILFQKGEKVPLNFLMRSQPFEQELERLRDQSFLVTVERLLGPRGGRRDRACLADVLSSELFSISPHRDLQPATSGDAAGRGIRARLLEAGFDIAEDVCARELAELVEKARRLYARIADPHALTRSAPGRRFDPSVHEPDPGCAGVVGESVVQYSLFPGYKDLRELVFTTTLSR
jgi:WD40 repeat protein